MEKDFLKLLVLLLGFSCVLESVASVPVTRSLKAREDNPSPVQSLLTQEAMGLSESEKQLVGYINVEGRMVVENTDDYPGTGANNRHDPKPPGKP